MNAWLLAAAVLMVGGLVPGMVLAYRGPAARRLAGLQLTGSVAALVVVLLSVGTGQSGYLIVPLVMVLLSFAGTLVFTRLLAARGGDDGP